MKPLQLFYKSQKIASDEKRQYSYSCDPMRAPLLCCELIPHIEGSWISGSAIRCCIALDTTVSSESYGCPYRFDHADDGKYIITVGSGKEKIIKEIEVNTITVVNRHVTIL